MRTTLTLDDDLARSLHQTARQTGKSFKEVVNRTLRHGLTRGAEPATALPPFEVRPVLGGLRAGIDPLKLNQLVDEMAIEDFQEKLERSVDDL